MTDSQGTIPAVDDNRPSKRRRLTDAAVELFHARGVERTSIADIAAAADVPLGNVYYYFRTKDALIDAAVTARVDGLAAGLRALEQQYDRPADRLKAWFHDVAQQAELISELGCPFGTLSTELEKRARGTDHHAAQLLQAPTDWATEQFRLMGCEDAEALGIEMLAAYQGTAVLTHAFKNPALILKEAGRVDAWIDSLDDDPARQSA